MRSDKQNQDNAARWAALGSAPVSLPPTLNALFLDTCARHAGRTALVDGRGSLTYAQARRAALLAAAAAACAESPHVGILLPPSKEYGLCFLGTLLAGKAAVPLNATLTPEELAFMIADAGVEHVFTARPLSALVDALPVRPLYLEEVFDAKAAPAEPIAADPGQAAAVVYTSGTTSQPKGVVLTHANFIANVEGCVGALQFGPEDVVLGPLPLFHSFAITTSLLLPVAVGAAAVYSGRFEPHRVLKLMAEHRATTVMAVPSMFRVLLLGYDPEQFDLRALRFCVAGGERLPAAVEHAFNERFPVPLLQGYGISEAAPVLSVNPPGANRSGTAGLPLPNVDMMVADDHGRPAAPGQEGELWARGQNIMRGYLNQPELTAAALAPGGWLRTGDWGKIDSDGYVTVTGRKKDLIISSGENISPTQIEDVLMQHPAVAEAAVLAIPHAVRGEVPAAFVVLRPDTECTEQELRTHCGQHLSRQKVPWRFEFRAEFPHGPTGKVLRRELRRAIREEKP